MEMQNYTKGVINKGENIMALGGYKFVGYKYTRPADYDSSVDAQVLAETLKMHKCKLKAFTESCAASGAQWDFSYSNGDYSFGTHGNVIYKLDSSGFNLVSFFRYGNEDAYYAIATLNDASNGSSTSLTLENRYYYYRGTTLTNTFISNDMCCSSLVDMNTTNINARPTLDRLAFMSQFGDSTSISKSVPSVRYYGYSTKDKCIIALTADSLFSGQYFNISAIDALSLSSPDDSKNIFSFTTTASDGGGSDPSDKSMYGYLQTLNSNGIPRQNKASYNTSNASPVMYILSPVTAICDSPSNYFPYEAAKISPLNTGLQNNPINSLGILSKGIAKIDFLSVNNVLPHANILPWKAYSNGNYLCVFKYTYTTAYAHMTDSDLYSKIVYVGWDPSNPDITQESAWTAYTG